MTTIELIKKAKAASRDVAAATTEQKNAALREMARALVEDTDEILAANALDVEAARGKISDVMIDRLALSPERIKGMADGILDAVSLGEFDTGSSSCKFVMDVRPMEKGGVFWANDDEFRELSDIANTAGMGLLMFGRKPARGASDECVACLMMRDCMDVPPWLLQPVSVLKERKFGTMAWMRRADEMIASMAEFRNWDVPKPED